MQSCAECGRSNRPDVRYCTQCGEPMSAPQAAPRGPSWRVSLAVLSIGVLIFLTIRPIAPHSTTVAAGATPAQQGHALRQPTPGAVESRSVSGGDGVSPDTPVRAENPSGAPAMHASETLFVPAILGAALETTQRLLEAAATPLDPAPATIDAAVISFDPAPTTLDAAPSLVDAAAPDSVVAASEIIEPAALDASRFDATRAASDSAPLALGDAEPAALGNAAPAALGNAGPPVRKAVPARAPSHARSPSSSPSRHAALDAASAGRVAKLRTAGGGSWLGALRAELEACGGDFIARTICRERAKFRHCGPRGAWGDVPECPAARISID